MDYLSELTTKNFYFFSLLFQHWLRWAAKRNALHSRFALSLSHSLPMVLFCLWIWINVCVAFGRHFCECLSLITYNFIYDLFSKHRPATRLEWTSHTTLRSRQKTLIHSIHTRTLLNVRFSNFKFTYNWLSLNILSEWIVGIVVRTGIYSACVYVTHFVIISSPRRASKGEEQVE